MICLDIDTDIRILERVENARNFCRRKSNEIVNSQEFILEWKNKLKEKESKARAFAREIYLRKFEKIWKSI